ncbi:ribosome biogenesis GTPase YlqF [Feifania hominis]|uniref:Ribosome biogenesis GTPase A n=1 Tax=Feifania hominis TaxID=2763660 RepID=A0A926HPT5_9FIRM|nr:ribosome biogenesis GTPase YlqF [Feifania hominis]MBC8535607.1 ribosome biogenesis GTPase YlqF [Feifania hominis]
MDEQQREKLNLQWYPGHMTKTRRQMEADLKLVDMVAEIVDARIPRSSRNPAIDEILGGKPRLILLNKADLSDPAANARWCDHYQKSGISAILIECTTGRGIGDFVGRSKQLLREKIERDRNRGMNKAIRIMIVGIPNVGKSSFINRMARDKKAKVEDRPGVTRGKQWIKVSDSVDLLDTPGILWPKFEDEQTALNLAFTGAIKDDIIDTVTLSGILAKHLLEIAGDAFCTRYKLDEQHARALANGLELVELIGRKRGFLISGGEIDCERTAAMILDEFRAGKIGRITLEQPEEPKRG